MSTSGSRPDSEPQILLEVTWLLSPLRAAHTARRVLRVLLRGPRADRLPSKYRPGIPSA